MMRGGTGSHLIVLGFTVLTIAELERTVQGVITAILLVAFLVAYLLWRNRMSRPLTLLGTGELVALSTGTEGFPLVLQLLLFGLILREQHLLTGLRDIGLFTVFSIASVGLGALMQAGDSPLAALPIAVVVFGGVSLAIAAFEYRQQKRFIRGA